MDSSVIHQPTVVPSDLGRDMEGKATRVNLLDFRSAPMRAFHLSWFAFFLCFVAWFGIAPLMAVVRDDLKLTKAQIGNTIIASVAITILARLLAGWMCDRYGPRRTYTALLILGAFPVMGHWTLTWLHLIPALSSGDWRDWRVVRHHTVPHVHYVFAASGGHGQRHWRGLGQSWRRRHAMVHAPSSRSFPGSWRGPLP